METRTCITCKQEKELTSENFYKNTECKKGFFNECKTCMGEKQKARKREKNKDKYMFI